MVIYFSHVHKEFPASFDIETLVSFLHPAAVQKAEIYFPKTTASVVPIWKDRKYVIWGTMANMVFGAT